jgi:hypothetical protein
MKEIKLLFMNLKHRDALESLIPQTIKSTFKLESKVIYISDELPERDIVDYVWDLQVYDYLNKFDFPAFLITDIPVGHRDIIKAFYTPGSVNQKKTKGFTSTYLYKRDINGSLLITLHQIGHMIGLTHHKKEVQKGKYCFMKPHNYYDSWGEQIAKMSLTPCNLCQLKISMNNFLRKRK